MSLYEHLNKPEGRWLRDLVLLGLVFGCLFLAGLGNAPLIDPDEGRYAEIPREMLTTGDFVTPTLNYVKYFEKPPLLYWLNAGSMAIFGKNELGARLPSALCGLFTVLLTYAAGRTLFDRRTGILAALILGSSAGFLLQSRIILTDMVLTFCLSAALFAFILAVQATGIQRRVWFYLSFVACGLAVLTKGLIGIVLPGGILFWYVVLTRQWRLIREIPWLTGGILFLVIVAPWFVLVSRANPEFLHFFFIREHFQRFTSTIHHRQQPFWFFLPILLVTMLPWSFMLPGSMLHAFNERHRNHGVSLYLLLWPCVILLFFSLSSSKLIPYILPIFPALAVLVAHSFSSSWRRHQPVFSVAAGSLAAVLIIVGSVIVFLPALAMLKPILANSGQTGRQFGELLYGTPPVLTTKILSCIGGLLIIPGLLVAVARKRRSAFLLVVTCALFGIMLEIALPIVYTRYVADNLSHRSLAMAIVKYATPQTLLAQTGPRQGLNFYTGRRLVTVGDADELTFGSQQGNQRDWFMSMEAFKQLWQSDRHVMIVARPHEAQGLQSLPGSKARIVATAGQAVLLANH